MKTAIELLKALTPLTWPILLSVVLWRLFPTLTAIIKSRSFSVKIAGMELSVQDATEQLKNQIEDLQRQVVLLRGRAANLINAPLTGPMEPQGQSQAVEPQGQSRPRVLWVDDIPSNNAFEIAQLQGSGIDVVQATSTEEAETLLRDRARFSAIISDMGRRESGAYRAMAGLDLLKAIKAAGYDTPFLVYSSGLYAAHNKQDVLAAGGDGATSSPVELLEWVRQNVRRG